MTVQFGANVEPKSNRCVDAFYAGLEHTFSKIGAIGQTTKMFAPKLEQMVKVALSLVFDLDARFFA
jgi:hypothetical protein